MTTEDRGKKLVCLFGSGISIPAGMPSTATLTQNLIPPQRFFRQFNSTWILGDPPLGYAPHNRQDDDRIRKVIEIISVHLVDAECVNKNETNLPSGQAAISTCSGLLIQTSPGNSGGLGTPRTNRPGCRS